MTKRSLILTYCKTYFNILFLEVIYFEQNENILKCRYNYLFYISNL